MFFIGILLIGFGGFLVSFAIANPGRYAARDSSFRRIISHPYAGYVGLVMVVAGSVISGIDASR